jgi:hypothetical protein
VTADYAAAAVWAVVLLALVLGVIALTSGGSGDAPRSSGVGAGALGAVYDLLNQHKRNAIELIVEEKAGARDPEDADGNLPDLEHPKPPR